jgi:hypothetical protein
MPRILVIASEVACPPAETLVPDSGLQVQKRNTATSFGEDMAAVIDFAATTLPVGT